MVQFQQLDRVVKAASRRLKHAVVGIAVALVGLAVWLSPSGCLFRSHRNARRNPGTTGFLRSYARFRVSPYLHC